MRPGDIAGRDLIIGSRVKVWFMSQGTAVIAIEPYTGPLAYLWPAGARIITFNAATPSGAMPMTVGNDDTFEMAGRTP